MSKYLNSVLKIDAAGKLGRVQPGTILDDLRHAAEKHGLTFGPDPATHSHCTLGGMIGNNSCGVHSVMAAFNGTGARTSDNVHELDILTYDGLRMRVGPTSEGELGAIIGKGGRRGEITESCATCATDMSRSYGRSFLTFPDVFRDTICLSCCRKRVFTWRGRWLARKERASRFWKPLFHLIPNPKARSLLVLGYPDVFSAGDHAPEIMRHEPIGLEGLDEKLIGYMRKTGLHPQDIQLLPEGKGWLLAEFGGSSKKESDGKAREVMAALRKKSNAPSMKLFDDAAEESKVWEVRESGLGATAFVPGLKDTWPGWEDSAVPPDKVGPYLRDLRKLFHKYDTRLRSTGTSGRAAFTAGFPSIFTLRMELDLALFIDEATDLVVITADRSRVSTATARLAPITHKMFGSEIVKAFREFKRYLGSGWKMNPGKVSMRIPLTANLRVGTIIVHATPRTHFSFPEDHGSFARAALRCVGVGECRARRRQTMCPSFR